MKNLLFVAAICVVFTFSCKKTTKNPAQNLFIGANFESLNWLAQPSTSYIPNSDTLKVQGLHADGNQNLVFKIPFAGAATYALKGNQASYYTTDGAGAMTSSYKLDTTKMNTVNITGFDIGTSIARGNFQLNFVKTSGGASFSNTAVFTNGQLWIQVP